VSDYGSQDPSAELAHRTGVDEASVRRILSELGLDAVVAELREQGTMREISATNLKLAVRIGRNTVCV